AGTDPARSAVTDPASGTVFIQEGPLSRKFVLQRDESYQGVGADHATLRFVCGRSVLRAPRGTGTAFLPDRRLDRAQDRVGNRPSRPARSRADRVSCSPKKRWVG